jgi:ABC-2 type transport system permease protein
MSARTDNQIVALADHRRGGRAGSTPSAPTGWRALRRCHLAEILRGVGSGSRFASIERGVLDLRDLVYYGSTHGAFPAC